jgi:hypothetical protein
MNRVVAGAVAPGGWWNPRTFTPSDGGWRRPTTSSWHMPAFLAIALNVADTWHAGPILPRKTLVDIKPSGFAVLCVDDDYWRDALYVNRTKKLGSRYGFCAGLFSYPKCMAPEKVKGWSRCFRVSGYVPRILNEPLFKIDQSANLPVFSL